MATNETRQKRSRTVVRYQMNLSFSSEEAKENFLTSLEKIKKSLSRRSTLNFFRAYLIWWTLILMMIVLWAMIVVLLLLLLAKDNQCWKTQVCLFSYLSYKVHNNYIIIIGIYTHASEDIDSMFICEMKTLRDLSAGLTQDCACGCLRWAMSDAIQSVLYECYSVNCSISVARTCCESEICMSNCRSRKWWASSCICGGRYIANQKYNYSNFM